MCFQLCVQARKRVNVVVGKILIDKACDKSQKPSFLKIKLGNSKRDGDMGSLLSRGNF